MNVKIVVVPLVTALVGGCAWLERQPCYIPGASYLEPYVESCYTVPTVVVESGCRPSVVRLPFYHAYRGDGCGRSHALDKLHREAHEQRKFAKDVARTQMKMQQKAAKSALKAKRR